VTEYRLIVRGALLDELQTRLEALYAYAKGYMDGHELVRQMTNIRTRFQQALREGEKRLEDMLFYWEGVQERLGQAGRLAAEMTRSIESLFPEEVREIEDAVKRAQEGVDSVMDEPGGAKVANITREAQRSVRGVLEGPLRRITSDCRLGVQNERGKLDSCVASIFAENAGREDYQEQVQKLIEAGGAPIEVGERRGNTE